MQENDEKKPANISRRDFLKLTSTVVAAGLAKRYISPTIQALNGSDAQESITTPEVWDPEKHLQKYFKGHTEAGNMVEITGEPQSIVIHEGKAKIQFDSGVFVDPLALKNVGKYADHPAETIIKLAEERNLSLDDEVKSRLKSHEKGLFHQVFYDNGQSVEGTITAVSIDATFCCDSNTISDKWKNTPGQTIVPDRFFVTPYNAQFSKQSNESGLETSTQKDALGKARKSEDMTNVSTIATTHTDILNRIGYSFDITKYGTAPIDQLYAVATEQMPVGYYRYDNYSQQWLADRFKAQEVVGQNATSIFDLNIVNGNMHYNSIQADGNYVHHRLTPDGNAQNIITSPVRLFTAFPNPLNENQLLIAADYDITHPMYHRLFVKDTSTGTDTTVDFPGDTKAESNELLAFFAGFTPVGFIVQRYGALSENGGLYSVNTNSSGWITEHSSKTQLLPVDHILRSFEYLEDIYRESPIDNAPQSVTSSLTSDSTYNYQISLPLVRLDPSNRASIVWTAKEVDSNFAMTVNVADSADINSPADNIRRLAVMGGWNPYLVNVERNPKTGKGTAVVRVGFNYDETVGNKVSACYRVDF